MKLHEECIIDGDAVLIPFGLFAKMSAKEFGRLQARADFESASPPENSDECQAAAVAYAAAFTNFAEIALAEFVFDPRFVAVLRSAVELGAVLTKAEVRQVFPDAAWE